jgi:hypothetical protein
MRRPRIRIWYLMLVVALTALGTTYATRGREFARQARVHREMLQDSISMQFYWCWHYVPPLSPDERRRHTILAEKYEYAAMHPWISVEPEDPKSNANSAVPELPPADTNPFELTQVP